MDMKVVRKEESREDIYAWVGRRIKQLILREKCPQCGLSFKDDPAFHRYIEEQIKKGHDPVTGKCPQCNWEGTLAW